MQAHYGVLPARRKWTGLRGTMDKIPGPCFPLPCYDRSVARYRSVQGSIFLSVSLLLSGVLLVFSLAVYDYVSAVARERFADTLTSLSRSVLANLDDRIRAMDRLSLGLVYSRVFQDLYRRHLSLPPQPATVESRIAKLENTEALIEICDTILGPNQSVPQLNVFDPRGGMIGSGYYSRLIERDARAEPWFAAVEGKQGERLILPPRPDPLLEETSVIVKGKLYVSLLRLFRDGMRSTQGIIEVKQYCDVLFGELDKLASPALSIYVADDSGLLLYPYPPDAAGEADGQRVLALARKPSRSRTVTGTLPGKRGSQIIAAAVSDETGWTLVIGESAAGLSASMLQYAARIALLALAAILCSLAASYLIARRITVPLKAMHAEMDGLDLENLDRKAEGSPGRGLGEIDSLRLAFHGMKQKLNDSLQEAVSLKAHEKQAQLAALQAQLNPHFIHNMLQTIAIMAENGEKDAIQELIADLAKVLRYASSTEEAVATLGSEIEYAECYLAAMRLRFGESFSFLIELEGEMRGIAAPKLVLQPFIENSFKYATSGRPPWNLSIRGAARGGRWEIEIADNGPGFSPEALETLANRPPEGEGLPRLSISGMGIVNSRERFRLFFGESASFWIGNGPEGGALVRMGAAT